MSKVRIVDYDVLASSAPLNSDAAKAYAMTGDLDPGFKLGTFQGVHSDVPIPTVRVPRDKEDLTGRKVGWLTVVGYAGTKKDGGGVWACRCVCGRYEVRKRKAIHNERNKGDACHRCRKVEQARRSQKRQAYFDRHGAYPKEDTA